MVLRILLAALPLALLVAAPVAAENPRVHQREPERYQAVPLPGQQARPGRGSADVADPEQRRGGFYRPPVSKKGDDDDDGKREMVGSERLWTTRDPPGKRGTFAFLGNKIGDAIDNVFPDMEEKDQFGMPLCRDTAGLPGFLDCTDDSVREMVNGAWKLMYRGVEVSYINYRYLDGKLAGFRMAFPTANFKALAEALKKQYGPPTAEEETSWKHRLGGVIDIEIQSWNTPHGEMTLRSRGAAMDAGMLALLEPKAEERFNDLRYRQVIVPTKPLGTAEEEFVLHPLPPKPGGTAQPAASPGNAAPAKAAP